MSKIDVLSLRTHEIANIFPRLTGEPREAMKLSIRRHGVQDAVTVWETPRGATVVIDGVNRCELVRELLDEGVEKSDNGADLRDLPYEVFIGSESAALDKVMSKNRERRHLSASQRAATTVRAGTLAKRYLSRDPEVPVEEADNPTVVQAASLASGASVPYIYKCIKLEKEAPDLLTQVIKGELSVPEAEEALRLRTTEREVPPESSTPSSGDDDEPEPVLDGLKQAVPPEWEDTFKTRLDFKAVATQFRKLKSLVEALAKGPGGAHVPVGHLTDEIGEIARMVTMSMPHAVCEHCEGSGKVLDEEKGKRVRCKACGGHGYLDKQLYKLVKEALETANA